MLIDRIRGIHCARDTGLLARYVGLETGRPLSLRLAGSADGLTAERVRQILANIRGALDYMALPELDAIAAHLDRHTPVFSGLLDIEIEKGGVKAHIEGLLRFAVFAGRPLPFQSYEIKGSPKRVILSDSQRELFDRYYGPFYAHVTRAGAISTERLHALMVSSTGSLDTDLPSTGRQLEAFIACLKNLDYPVFESEEATWIGAPGAPGLPVTRIKRLLQATPAIELSSRTEEKVLNAGLSDGERLPRNILMALLARERIHVVNNVVKYVSSEEISTDCTLIIQGHASDQSQQGEPGTALHRMISIIRAEKGRMPKKAFFDACTQAGIALATARVYGYNSGLFTIEREEIALRLPSG